MAAGAGRGSRRSQRAVRLSRRRDRGRAGLPIVETPRWPDTDPMSSQATPHPGNPNAIGNPVYGAYGSADDAGRHPGGPGTSSGPGGPGASAGPGGPDASSGPAAPPRRASRLRRGIFSLLDGARLAAGGGALILMVWGAAEILRSYGGFDRNPRPYELFIQKRICPFETRIG